MEYRDDRDALRQRADSLEDELAETNERLKAARDSLAAQAEKDKEDERRVAELEEQANELRRRLGLPPGRVISKPKQESSAVPTVGLLILVAFALLAVGGVLTFAIMSSSAGAPPPPPSPASSSSPAMALVGGVFALFGLPLVGLALWTFSKDRDIAKWPRVEGKILGSRIETSSYSEKDQYGYNRQGTAYSPEVSYTYVVDGTEYEGSEVARSVATTTNRAAVQACLDRYPAGKEVTVLCDPTDPTTAYLEVRRSIGAIILLGFGGLLVGIGVLLSVLYFLA